MCVFQRMEVAAARARRRARDRPTKPSPTPTRYNGKERQKVDGAHVEKRKNAHVT